MRLRARRSSCFKIGSAAALVGLVFAWLTLSGSSRIGVTFDELGHIVSGYSYWKFDDYRINPENGVLSTRAGALPLLSLPWRFPDQDHPHWRDCNARALGYDFFYQLGNDRDALLHRARYAATAAALVVLWLVWRWTRGLFGRRAGLLAVGLATFSPTLLAHAGLATSDMMLTACLLGAVSAWWWLSHRITIGRLLLAALAAGLTFTAKMSGLLLVPLLAVLLVLRCATGRPLPVALGPWKYRTRRRLATGALLLLASGVAAVGSVGVVWAGYGFRYASHPPTPGASLAFEYSWDALLAPSTRWPPGSPGFVDDAAPTAPGLTQRAALGAIRWTRDHRLLPEAFLWGLGFTVKASRGREAFLRGEYSSQGWAKFFPLAFLWKSTPAEILLGVAGAGTLGFFVLRRRIQAVHRPAPRLRWLYRLTPLLVLFLGYWSVAIATPLNIGHRHLLPVYPVVFILAGAAGGWIDFRRRRIATILLCLLVGGQIAGAFGARPFYSSYFTPFVGGQSQGWRYLVDSSFDWGQGLPDFSAWLKEKEKAGDASPVHLTYFGSDSPRARNLPVVRFADWRDDHGPRNFSARLQGGWYAISATHFHRVYLRMPGPWTEKYERRYQETDRQLRFTPEAAARLTPEDRARLRPLLMDYEVLQFGRLCHFLQNRQPEQIIGGSILLFKLSAAEVHLATQEPLDVVNAQLAREGPRRP